MMAGSHVVLGAAAWMVVAPHLGLPAAAPVPLGLAVLGAMLPDVDHPKSWVGRRLRPVSTPIAKLLGHRGVTHSLAAAAGCTWLLWRHGLPRAELAPVVVGYLSHLAADLLTPGGLRLAWPLKGTWALPLCRTGSPAEPLVVALVVAWALCGTFGVARVERELRTGWTCRLGVFPSPACVAASRRGPAPHLAATLRRLDTAAKHTI
jgi:inner membrane protein